ncbi:MAG: hydroxyacylglutathione hydrolase [Deltaproteobacteria bacterium GWD2_55_8]|nr:MAG: hydroxyacylglutathione hydrolase [Deltaproteobacteria bacterium GWD2_55_8]
MRIVQIPLLRDNYAYLIVCEKTNNAAIVDPSEAGPILSKVKEEKVTLRAILNTHHHHDHTGGNPGLLDRWTLQVYGYAADKERIPGLTHPLNDGDEVRIGELTGKVLFIPGHTRGHIAYLFENKLFCGDTLFVAGCGRLFEGTAEQMHDSLTKLRQLPEDTLVYCGHEYTEKNIQFALTLEPNNKHLTEKMQRARSLRAKGISTVPSTMAEEMETNPFLRWESKEIQDNLRKNFPHLGLDPVSVFAKIRELKDQF